MVVEDLKTQRAFDEFKDRVMYRQEEITSLLEERVRSREDPSRFAVVKLSGEPIDEEDARRAVSSDLALLSRLGLYPIVIHGGSKQYDKELGGQKVGNIRVTTEEMLDKMLERSAQINESLVSGINSYGGNAKGLIDLEKYPILVCYKHPKVEGVDPLYVGEIKRVNKLNIQAEIEFGQIPVLRPIGYDEKNSEILYNVHADHAARALVLAFRPRNIVFLTNAGGVVYNGELIREVSSKDLAKLIKSEDVSGGMEKKLAEIHELSEILKRGKGYENYTPKVHITSPYRLIEGLFSEKEGTVIQLGVPQKNHCREKTRYQVLVPA